MGKVDRNDFTYLGVEYQKKLIKEIITDYKFANSIIDIIQPNYFGEQFLKVIVAEIKDAYDSDDVIPDIDSLRIRLMDKISNEIQREYILGELKKIEAVKLNDSFKTQELGLGFCKHKELVNGLKEAQKLIDKGSEDYDRIEEIIKKAIDVGDNKDDAIGVLDNIEDVLKEDFRQPIPTGISGLDEIMNGGLAKSELAVILAPFGVGKTTLITYIANTSKDMGLNVLQIFFEDTPKVIQRKHLCCWYNKEQEDSEKINLNDLIDYKDELIELKDRKTQEKGEIKLKKFPSDGTTVPKIRQYIRKLISQGFKPDVILLDYIDCVVPSKVFKESWDGEGNVMRQFETLLAEFNMAGWTAVQGNRSSIKAEVVESDQIGGSIKKGQIGHFILSIAKTLEQKETGKANMAVLKSRFGKDGVIFEDVIFDNGKVNVNMTESRSSGKTFLQTREVKKERDMQAANDRTREILGGE